MLDVKGTYSPSIIYRPIQPSDLEALEQIHAALFPIRYERDFFVNVVNGHEIVSWAAVDIGRPEGETNELVGFVTTRIVAARESEIEDLLGSGKDKTLVYILTLGVVEHYRNLGIASALVREVIKYGSRITSCRAVYLHVIDYNQPAIRFYTKMRFQLLRRLSTFYYIKGQHYDAYLFVYYVNGGRSPCSPLDIVAAVASYFRGLFTTVTTKLWKNEGKKIPRWPKCKETSSLIAMHNVRILGADNALCQCV